MDTNKKECEEEIPESVLKEGNLEHQRVVRIARNLMRSGISLEDISKSVGIPVNELAKLNDLLFF